MTWAFAVVGAPVVGAWAARVFDSDIGGIIVAVLWLTFTLGAIFTESLAHAYGTESIDTKQFSMSYARMLSIQAIVMTVAAAVSILAELWLISLVSIVGFLIASAASIIMHIMTRRAQSGELHEPTRFRSIPIRTVLILSLVMGVILTAMLFGLIFQLITLGQFIGLLAGWVVLFSIVLVWLVRKSLRR